MIKLLLFLNILMASIKPGPNKITSDIYFNYQWSLYNHGFEILRDTSDIHPIVIRSEPKKDIAWTQLQQVLQEREIKKRPLVAVIDSGLSVSHEEFRQNEQIYKNKIECRFGNIIVPRGPNDIIEDKDNNGFPADCIGWNFTSDNPKERNNVFDDIGHGTHVSGIIAATIDNSKGIAGISDLIQILPIKVYAKSNSTKQQKKFIERIQAAIEYAMLMKVDVINLSLGWPLLSHNQKIIETIQKAQKQNIIFVAGAGNDSHNARVFPCSMKDVICVGATSVDGKYAPLSNYGAFVDILAPGDKILSTWPASLFSQSFGPSKYELLSGTSQATPIISAIVALMRAYNPQITVNEIRARLALAAIPVEQKIKYSQSGLVHLEKSLLLTPRPYIEVNFKNSSVIHKNNNSELTFNIENLWTEARNIQLKITSPSLNLNKTIINIKRLKAGETKPVSVAIRKFYKEEGRHKVFVEVTADRYNKKFQHEFSALKNMNSLIKEKYFIPTDQNTRSVFRVQRQSDISYFYSIKKLETDILLSLYKIQNGVFTSYQTKIHKADALFPQIGVMSLDMNHDGDEEIIVTTQYFDDKNNNQTLDQDELVIRQLYFSDDLKLVSWLPNSLSLKDEGLIYQPQKMLAIPIDYNGKIYNFPAYTSSQDFIPQNSQNPDPFERQAFSNNNSLYALVPKCANNKCKLEADLFTNYKLIGQIKKQLKIQHDQSLFFTYYQQKGEAIESLLLYGRSANLKFALLTFNSKKQLLFTKPLELPGLDLRFHIHKFLNNGASLMYGIDSHDRGRIVWINKDKSAYKILEVKTDSRSESLNNFLDVYLDNNKRLKAFIESEYYLYHMTWDLNLNTDLPIHKDKTPIYRFSYLPGNYFSDSFFSLKLSGGEQILGTDSSLIHERAVYMWQEVNGKILNSGDLSFALPKECHLLSPIKAQKTDYLYALCNEKEGYNLLKIQ